MKIGDWVLVHFPKDEAGRNQKLSRPWHGLYRVIEKQNPDVTLCKIYFLRKTTSKFIRCEYNHVNNFPLPDTIGTAAPGCPPKWV